MKKMLIVLFGVLVFQESVWADANYDDATWIDGIDRRPQ